jgi:RiboL-PSP-HEPN
MASKARASFDRNAKDIKRLLDLHTQVGGNSKGRRYGLEVLNKSAIVLITSFWEAYCEDIAAEGLEHLVEHAKKADSLPIELKKQIAKAIKKEPNEIELWKIADDCWRQHLRDRFSELKQDRDRRLNTPKTANINELFMSAVGIERMSDRWKWAKKMTAKRASDKLDKFVELRGSIAHRGQPATSVTKAQVTDYFEFIKQLTAKTGGAVNQLVKSVTAKPLWK